MVEILEKLLNIFCEKWGTLDIVMKYATMSIMTKKEANRYIQAKTCKFKYIHFVRNTTEFTIFSLHFIHSSDLQKIAQRSDDEVPDSAPKPSATSDTVAKRFRRHLKIELYMWRSH